MTLSEQILVANCRALERACKKQNKNGHHRLELVIRYHESNFIKHGVVDLILEALGCLTYLCEVIYRGRAERIFTGSPGRPKFNIPYKQLNFLPEG